MYRYYNRLFLLIGILSTFAIASSTALANPTGGKVSVGQVVINEKHKKLDVIQKTSKAIIDWRDFDIAKDEVTQFHQPSSNATVLNRVNSKNPSQIMGQLKANGNVIIANPNGVLFSKDSIVDVNSIVATTAHLSNEEFANDRMIFTSSDNPTATISNEGIITAKEAGLVGFVAPNVLNSGSIVANAGSVQLSSGDKMTLDLYGDKLMEVAVSDKVASQLILQSGSIQANDGKIVISTSMGKEIVNNIIDVSGKIQATSISHKDGKIFINAAGGTAKITGNIDAKGEGQKGGKVSILGDNVKLSKNAVINTSGSTGGGSIKIGGNLLGKGKTPTSKNTSVGKNVVIYNDALQTGNGGKTVVWSDNTTKFRGSIYSRGGKVSGNGGFVETSGKQLLNANGFVDTTAAAGASGTYLLDPSNILVRGNFSPLNIPNNVLWLDPSNESSVSLVFVSTSTTATGVSGSNTITTASNISNFLFPGTKIRLGPTSQFTVANASGTTVTLEQNLDTNYTGAIVYNSVVSAMADQSSLGLGSVTQSNPSAHGLLYATGPNNNKVLTANGNEWLASPSGPDLTSDVSVFSVASMQDIIPKNFGETIWGSGGNTGQAINMEVNRNPNGGRQSSIWNNVVTNRGTLPLTPDTYYILGNIRTSSLGDWVSDLYVDGHIDNNSTTLVYPSNANSLGVAALSDAVVRFRGRIGDILAYDRSLADAERNLVEQYQSAKWNIALNPPGSGATEVQKATSPTGYSDFTADYLKRLSTTSDIVLQATNNITLDLRGQNLSLPSDRNISLISDNGTISSITPGSITTSRASTGGNITIDANGHGMLNLGNLSLNAQNGGEVAINSLDSMTLGNIQAGKITAVSSANVIIPPGKTLSATDSGDSIVLVAAQNFINQAGSTALNILAGRWLVYSTNPALDTNGGIVPSFRRFNCTYGGSCPTLASGNGFLYTFVPTLTASPQTLNLAYHDPAPDLTPYTYNISGYLSAIDTNTDTVTGALNGTTNYIQDSLPGNYNILYDNGNLNSELGYTFNYSNNANGIIVSNPNSTSLPSSLVTTISKPISSISEQNLWDTYKVRARKHKYQNTGYGSENNVYMFDGALEVETNFAKVLRLIK